MICGKVKKGQDMGHPGGKDKTVVRVASHFFAKFDAKNTADADAVL